MIKRLFFLTTFFFSFTLSTDATSAAKPFYEGKTVTIIVGTTAGGSFDAYARLMARHMGKYIPGHPTMIVQNMPGAGGLISVNHLYKIAKPDGLTLTHFNGALVFNQAFGEPGVEFDARKFVYIGAPIISVTLAIVSKTSGITSIDKMMASNKLVRIGTTEPGAGNHNFAAILRDVLGLPIDIISGYKGISDARLAFESGEVDGLCVGWDTAKPHYLEAIESGDMHVLVQGARKPHPDLPKVPLVLTLAKTDEARRLTELGIIIPAYITRTFALPPGTPKEKTQILRKAFNEALKDKQLISEATKAKMGITPSTGDEVERVVGVIFKSDPALLVKLKKIIYK